MPRRDARRDKKVLMCVDLETSGPRPSAHGILGLGMAVYFPETGKIDSYCFPVALEPGKTFDPITKSQFWDCHPLLLESLQNRAEPIQVALQRFVDTLDFYDSRHNVTLVLDNPSFDCAFLNDAMDRLMGRKGICYTLDKQFRMPLDMRSFGIGALLGETEFREFRQKVLSKQDLRVTHSPDQDCILNLKVYLATLDHLANDAELSAERVNARLNAGGARAVESGGGCQAAAVVAAGSATRKSQQGQAAGLRTRC